MTRKTPQQELIMMFLKDALLVSDPPLHTTRRRIITPELTVRGIARLEPWVREVAERSIDAVEPGTTYDFVHEIAEVLPVSVALELLGIPRQDHQRFVHLVDSTASFDATAGDDVIEPMMEIFTYLQSFCRERQANPGDDLISVVATAEEHGAPLAFEDVLKYAFLLLLASIETTRALLARGVQALALYPHEKRRVVSGEVPLTTAIEEMLRWGTSLAVTARTALTDVTVRGTGIRAGDYVYCYMLSANRDEEVFGDDADDFVADRHPNPHVAFGFGEHFCIGASLARLEARVFFEALLARYTEWELIGEPEPFRNFEMFRSFNTMPIVFHR